MRLDVLPSCKGLFLFPALDDVVHNLSDETLARLVDVSIAPATAGGATSSSATTAHVDLDFPLGRWVCCLREVEN